MPIALTAECDAPRLRAIARSSKNAGQTRRLLALASIYDGATRTGAAAIGGVTLQIVRDWVLKLNANGPDGLIDRQDGGTPSILSDAYRQALATTIEDGPIPDVHRIVRSRVIDRCQWLWDGYAVVISNQTLNRGLRQIGYADCRPGRTIMPRLLGRSKFLKKSLRASERDWAHDGCRPRRSRGLVCRRSQGCSKEQDHPALGTAGLAHGVDLHFRCDLSDDRKGTRNP